jgi:GTPase SAR1 family protein
VTDPWTAIPTAAVTAYQRRREIKKLWDKISGFILGAKAQIALTGMSGVGKTVLVDHLTGRAYKVGYEPPERRSFDVEQDKLKRDRKRMAFSVVPGQDSPQRTDSLMDVFQGDKPVDGIIHVVCNGFTALRDPDARAVLVSQGIDTVEKFRHEQMKLELKDFAVTASEVRRSIRKHQNRPWLIVVVDKLDLFSDADARMRARSYYAGAQGEFTQALEELQSQVGKDNIVCDVVPSCSWLEDFNWGNETVESKLTVAQRDGLLLNFLKMIEERCG